MRTVFKSDTIISSSTSLNYNGEAKNRVTIIKQAIVERAIGKNLTYSSITPEDSAWNYNVTINTRFVGDDQIPQSDLSRDLETLQTTTIVIDSISNLIHDDNITSLFTIIIHKSSKNHHCQFIDFKFNHFDWILK